MPYISKWVPAPKFMTYRGVTLYRLYKYDEMADGGVPRTMTFGLTPDCSDSDPIGQKADVRDMPGFAAIYEAERPPFIKIGVPDPDLSARWEAFHEREEAIIKQVLRHAIKVGFLKPPPPEGN